MYVCMNVWYMHKLAHKEMKRQRYSACLSACVCVCVGVFAPVHMHVFVMPPWRHPSITSQSAALPLSKLPHLTSSYKSVQHTPHRHIAQQQPTNPATHHPITPQTTTPHRITSILHLLPMRSFSLHAAVHCSGISDARLLLCLGPTPSASAAHINH